jgi:Tfp pilus assembly protein PilF
MKRKIIFILFLCLNLTLCASSQKKIQAAREKDPKYQYNMGLFYLNNNNLEEAVKYLNRALALDARHFLSMNALGLISAMKGDFPQAVAYYQKCLQVEPSFSEARNNLGTAYQELGDLDKAQQEFQKAIDDPAYNSKELPFYNMARLAFTQGDSEKALERVQTAIKLNPRLAMAHNLKGLIMEKLDRLAEAIADYERAIRIVPEDVNFNFNLAAASFKDGNFGRAKEIFLKISPRVTDQAMRAKINDYLKEIK